MTSFLKNAGVQYSPEHVQAFQEISLVTENYKSVEQSKLLESTQKLFKLLDEVGNPVEFLFYMVAVDPNCKVTALKLLVEQYIPTLVYTELEAVINVENFHRSLQQFYNHPYIEDFYTNFSLKYWLQNQCFQNGIETAVLNSNFSITKSLIDKIDTLIQTQGVQDAEDEKTLVIQNQHVYQTVKHIQAVTLPKILNFIVSIGQQSDELLECLGKALDIDGLQVKPSKNQMSMKIQAETQSDAQIFEFCQPANILILLETNSQVAFRLVCKILESRYAANIFVNHEALIAGVIKVIDAGNLHMDHLSQIFLPINQNVLSQEWLIKMSDLTKQTIQNHQQLSVQTFNRVILSWKPILLNHPSPEIFEFIGSYVTQFLENLVVALDMNNAAFLDDDMLFEHIESQNSVSLKEILLTSVQMLVISRNTSLIQKLPVILQELVKAGETNIYRISYLLNIIRLYYKECVRFQAKLMQNNDQIDEIIVNNCATLGEFIIKLDKEEVLGSYCSTLQPSELNLIKYSITTCKLSLTKSLLSQRVPQKLQIIISDKIYVACQMQTRDEILQHVLKFCLLQIEYLKQHKSNELFEKTLKFLVYITITKPYIVKDRQVMEIKSYMSLDFQMLLDLQQYLVAQLSETSPSVDFKQQRMVVASISTLMCEFDTVSEDGQVIESIYRAIETKFEKVVQARANQEIGISQFIYLMRLSLSDLRGLFQGMYRSRQFMKVLLDKFMTDEQGIYQFISKALCSTPILMENEVGVAIEDKLSLSKSILKLICECTDDSNQRMQFDNRYNSPIAFMEFSTRSTASCLGVLKLMDTQTSSNNIKEAAMSLIKKAMKISLQIGRNEQMSRKQLEMFPQLRTTFQDQLQSLYEGLYVFMQPTTSLMTIASQDFLKLFFQFINFVIDRYFGMILGISQQVGNATYFAFLISVISEGQQTTLSIPFLTSKECISQLHTFAIRGSKFYRQAMTDLLQAPEVKSIFMKIVKINLKSFLRKEQTNRSIKTDCTAKILNMYRLHFDAKVQGQQSFYLSCIEEITSEYEDQGQKQLEEVGVNDQMDPKSLVQKKLVDVAQGVNWDGKPDQFVKAYANNLDKYVYNI